MAQRLLHTHTRRLARMLTLPFFGNVITCVLNRHAATSTSLTISTASQTLFSSLRLLVASSWLFESNFYQRITLVVSPLCET
ncbi:hypothetical protein EPR50_G00006390 [Perca flavescens]|uniref:Uncharacterized protein n=1 Tax=Perca flavescens TaxID=8167 RepID=A0A484DPQ2_PERFV|nr:hypothetical protein EPR50_G00006390 [Perca flavescens]